MPNDVENGLNVFQLQVAQSLPSEDLYTSNQLVITFHDRQFKLNVPTSIPTFAKEKGIMKTVPKVFISFGKMELIDAYA